MSKRVWVFSYVSEDLFMYGGMMGLLICGGMHGFLCKSTYPVTLQWDAGCVGFVLYDRRKTLANR